MRRVASRQNPIVARYRDAARGDADGIMLLDGVHLVSEALEAGTGIREAAVAADADRHPELPALLAKLERAHIDTTMVTAPVLAALSPVRSTSPVVALADRPVAAAPATGVGTLVVVAVDVQDPGNLGAIVRVAEAGGATGVVVAGASADPFGWKALRGSMGSALRVPIAVSKGADMMPELRQRGCRVIAAVPRGGRSLFEIDLTGAVAILVGGEGAGLSSESIANADERVSIPMEASVESLNAAVTAALLVYEARRQREASPSRRRERA